MTKPRFFLGFIAFLIQGCVSVPEGLQAVDDLNIDRYMGTWYEIARLDHRFERGLSNVTATYSVREEGGIRVVNRGYSDSEQAWEEAVGKAYPVDGGRSGELKVSFFGPFYASYNVIRLAPDYEYAVVTGPDRDYLWILARDSELDKAILSELKQWLADRDFAVDQLIYPSHDRKEG